MRALRLGCLVAATALALAATPALAQVSVVLGTTWDAPSNSLQNILDARYGAGNIDVATDYIGHDAGDPDPFTWSGLSFHSLLIREVAGHANNNTLGWYRETGAAPVIDGVDDGVVFTGPMGQGEASMVTLGPGDVSFGFWLNPNGPGNATNAPEPELFFTNRLYNDIGPNGSGAVHAPFDGDMQALVFDVSTWTQPNTWVVCFEDLDSGPDPTPCCSQTDNDFNDLVFEVTVARAVGVEEVVFTAIKALYR
jgi:hypothetical protein